MRLSACLLVFLGCTPSYAQSSLSTPPDVPVTQNPEISAPALSPTDFLIVTAGFEQFTAGTNGGNGSIDWVHTDKKARTYTAGGAMFSVADSRWTFGKVGAAFHAGGKAVIQGQVRIGSGHTGSAGFPYQIYDGGLTYKASHHVYLDYRHQYLLVDHARGHLLMPGVMFIPFRRSTAEVTYTHSALGNLGAGFVTGRLDFTMRPLSLLCGASAGHTTPEVFNIDVGSQPANQDFREIFFGIRVPLSRAEFDVVSEFSNLGATHRRTVTLALKVPLRR